MIGTLASKLIQITFAFPFERKGNRKFSSAGSEHLPYKQRVGGSNPSTSTSKPQIFSGAFLFLLMSCDFYILFSRSKDRFYIGHTCEGLAERLRKHNSNHKGFTGGLADWEVVYYEEHINKTSAYQRERIVKSWKSRKKIEELMSN